MLELVTITFCRKQQNFVRLNIVVCDIYALIFYIRAFSALPATQICSSVF